MQRGENGDGVIEQAPQPLLDEAPAVLELGPLPCPVPGGSIKKELEAGVVDELGGTGDVRAGAGIGPAPGQHVGGATGQ